MDEENRWQELVRGFREGDAQIIGEFWGAYGPMLHRIAEKHLGARLRARVGPEDIVQSACRTFFRRVQGGQLRMDDSESLWRLLCAITLTKIREQARYHLRQRRGVDREVPLTPAAAESGASAFHPAAPGPSPDEEAAFTDQFQQLLSSLEEEERQIIDLKLQEYTHEEVADKLGLSERTVRRIFKRIQTKLLRAFDDSVGGG